MLFAFEILIEFVCYPQSESNRQRQNMKRDEVSKEVESRPLRMVFETLMKRCTPSPPPPTVCRFLLCFRVAARARLDDAYATYPF